MSVQKPTESFNIREAKGVDINKLLVVNESLKNYQEKYKYYGHFKRNYKIYYAISERKRI